MRRLLSVALALLLSLTQANALGPVKYATTQPYTSITPVDAILSSTTFKSLMKAGAGSINSIGAVGGNQALFQAVGLQRQAYYYFQHGFLTATSSEVEQAWLAWSYGFSFQNGDGTFQCPQCQGNLTATLQSQAFFLAYFAECYLAIKNSSYWTTVNSRTGNTFQVDYNAFLPKLKLGVASLQSYEGSSPYNVPGGFQLNADRNAPNRLFFDGIAIQIGGQILNTTLNGGVPYCGSTLGDGTCSLTATGNVGSVTADAIQTGIVLVNAGIALQAPTPGSPTKPDPEGVGGYFLENGGPDTSYNATSMLSVGQLAIISLNQGSYTTPLLTVLARAATWQLSRAQGNGTMSWAYNTRVAPGLEIGPSGLPKAINYFEVPLSLFYASVVLNSLNLNKIANAIAVRALSGGCIAEPTTIVGPVTAFHVTPPPGCNAAVFVLAGEGGNGGAGSTTFGGGSGGGGGAAGGPRVALTTDDVIVTLGGGGSSTKSCAVYNGSTNCASDPNRFVADFGTNASGATPGTAGQAANSFPTTNAYSGKGGLPGVSLGGGVGGSNFGFSGGNSGTSPSQPYGGGGGAGGVSGGGSPSGLNGGTGAFGFNSAPGGVGGTGSATTNGGPGGAIGFGFSAGGGGGGLTQAAAIGGAGGDGGQYTLIDGSVNQLGGGGGGGGGSLLGVGGSGGKGGVAASGGGGGFGGGGGGAGGPGGPGDIFIFWSYHSSGAFTDSGPITVSGQSGKTITGLHIHGTSGNCVTVINSTNVTFVGNDIGPCGTNGTDSASNGISIDSTSSAIHIYDNYIHVENQVNNCTKSHVAITAPFGMAGAIDIKGNVIAYSERAAWLDQINNITVDGNFILNLRSSITCGSPANKFPHGVQVWSDTATMMTGTSITNNYLLATAAGATVNGTTVLFPGASSDVFNVNYTTNAVVSGNYVDLTGASSSGNVETGTCGVIADIGTTGSTLSNNIVSNAFNCGVAMASGNNTTISGNKVLTLLPTSNSAAAIILEPGGSCSTVAVNNNTAFEERSSDGYNQAFYSDGFCTGVTFSGNTGGSNLGTGCSPEATCPAYIALFPMATTNPPPTMPPVPHTCVARSPYSTSTAKPPC